MEDKLLCNYTFWACGWWTMQYTRTFLNKIGGRGYTCDEGAEHSMGTGERHHSNIYWFGIMWFCCISSIDFMGLGNFCQKSESFGSLTFWYWVCIKMRSSWTEIVPGSERFRLKAQEGGLICNLILKGSNNHVDLKNDCEIIRFSISISQFTFSKGGFIFRQTLNLPPL